MKNTVLIWGLCLLFSPTARTAESTNLDSSWLGEQTFFHSFVQYDFKVEGFNCKVVVPETIGDGKPWVWRARFWGHEPQTDKALLNKGFHVVYADVGGLYGSPKAVKRWDDFYKYLHGFEKKTVLEGMSRGGLIIFNWAAQNSEKVHCIYADAPVCDFKSWPGISQAIMNVYGLTKEQAESYKGNPVDNLRPLANAGIPLLQKWGDLNGSAPVQSTRCSGCRRCRLHRRACHGMKRNALLKYLRRHGCELFREGGSHSWWETQAATYVSQSQDTTKLKINLHARGYALDSSAHYMLWSRVWKNIHVHLGNWTSGMGRKRPAESISNRCGGQTGSSVLIVRDSGHGERIGACGCVETAGARHP